MIAVTPVAQRQTAAAGGSAAGGAARRGPSADEQMQRAAAKAKQEAADAAADAQVKSADAEAKEQGVQSAIQETAEKDAALRDIQAAEAAEGDADKIGGAKPASPGDPSSAELLKQAEAKAQQDRDDAVTRSDAASEAADQADAAAKAAKALAEAKAKAAAEVEAKAASVHQTASDPAPDTAKELPRAMERDCKPISNQMPDAPDNIELCKPHGHVVDVAKKLIVAETPEDWYRDHPVAKPAPAAPAKPAPTAAPGGDTRNIIGSTVLEGTAQGRIHDLGVTVVALASGDLQCLMLWWGADSPAGDAPAAVHEEVQISWGVDEEIGTLRSPSHMVEAGKQYRLEDTLKGKPRAAPGYYRIVARIVAEGMNGPLLELDGAIYLRSPAR